MFFIIVMSELITYINEISLILLFEISLYIFITFFLTVS